MTAPLDPLDLCDRVLALVAKSAGAEAVVTTVTGRSGLTRFANSFIHQNTAEAEVTVSLRAVVDGRAALASTSRTDDAVLAGLVERTLAAARLRPPDPDWPGLGPAAPLTAGEHYDAATAAASPEARAAVVKAFLDAGPDLAGAGFCSTDGAAVALATSAGQRLVARTSQATVDGVLRAGSADGSGSQTSVRLADLDGSRAGATAAAKATAGLDPVDLDPGVYEVVLEPTCVAGMLDFLAYAGFNAKAFAEGTSFVHLGEAQFDESVSIWDDLGDPRAVGWPFDLDGTPRRRVDLVHHGVTTGLVHDRRTAAKAGTESTGHASGSDSFGPIPMNLFLAEGTSSRQALIGAVDRGLLVTDFWYTRILDPKTQVVTGLTRNGLFLIEGGEVTTPVKNLRFTQSFVAALGPGHVMGIGDDGRLTGGELPIVAHVPSLHLASWNFTGGAKG